jgi:hypothetical protein
LTERHRAARRLDAQADLFGRGDLVVQF